jgi:putative ABC transport system permease protein
MWTLLSEISFRHLRFSPLRTALVVLGIALGVCMLCAVLATNDSLVAAFEDMVDRVAGKADLTVAGSSAGIPSTLTGEIADLEGVQHAAAMLEVVTRSADGKGGALLVMGVDFLGDTFFLPFAQEGEHKVIEDPLAFVNDPTAILISKHLAAERGLKVGDAIPLVTTSRVTNFYVRGLLDDSGPAASFGGQVVVMFIDAAQVSFARGYAVDRIDVVVEPGHQIDDVRKRIQAHVEGTASVERPKGRLQRLLTAFWSFRNGLNMSGFISLGVGMFLIYNAVSVSVAQRRKEVGTLRALGVTRGSMVRLFCAEALLMALLGSALGLWLASGLARFVMKMVYETVDRMLATIHAPAPEITPKIMVAGFTAGIFTTLLASYLPARVASRVDPAEALRASRATALSRALPTKKYALLGLLVVSIAAVPSYLGGELNGYIAAVILAAGAPLFVPLTVKLLRRILLLVAEPLAGIPGRLALDNAERALGRSAITVVALMLAVALSMSTGAYTISFERSIMEWIDGAIPSEASITAGSPILDRKHTPFPSSVLERFADIPGLSGVNPLRITGGNVNGTYLSMSALDTELLFRELARKGKHRTVVEGPMPFEARALADKPRALISENLSAREDLHPGDKYVVGTPSGPHEFEIYAVVVDYSSDQGWMMLDLKWYREYWQDELVDSIDLTFVPGADSDKVMNVVRERLRDTPDLFVSRQEDVRIEVERSVGSMFSFAKAPEFITLLVAIMGVIGTMLAAVIDRIREVGVLRAIGATRRQVVMSLMWESGFLGMSATLIGLIVGVPLGLVLLKVIGHANSGWSLPYMFPVNTALRISLLITGAAVIAGFLPGRRAAKLDVKEALSFE